MNFPNKIRPTDIAVCILVLACIATWLFVPPFQSPDEFEHIRGAYLLGGGKVLMESRNGGSSGGMIDAGLENYMATFIGLPFSDRHKIGREQLKVAAGIQWEGNEVFSCAPTSSSYFPLIYLPHFTGLWIGKTCGFSVALSYHLARLFCLAVLAGTLLVAFRIYEPSPLTLCLLAMPMTVFQASSATIDGISTGVAVLAISLFFRFSRDGKFAAGQFLFFVGILALLGSCRIFAAPLFLAALWACGLSGKRWPWVVVAAGALFVAGWTLIAVSVNVDTRTLAEGSCRGNFFYYASHPLEFPKILAATLADPMIRHFYKATFIGVLGWLDTPLPQDIYALFGLCLPVAAICSAAAKPVLGLWKPRLVLLLCSALSALLLFYAILVQWNPRPAAVISGIQGRYFLIPALMFSYAISAPKPLLEGWVRRVALVAVSLSFVASLIVAMRVLADRYFC